MNAATGGGLVLFFIYTKMIPYQGGKRRQKRIILETLQDSFDVFVDVFGGSAAVSSFINAEYKIYNDLDPVIYNVIRDLNGQQEYFREFKRIVMEDDADTINAGGYSREITVYIDAYLKILPTHKNIYPKKIDNIKKRIQRGWDIKRLDIDEFRNLDFADIISETLERFKDKRVFFYLDNPYLEASKYNTRFTFSDMERLVGCVRKIDEAGQFFLWHNSYEAYIRENYANGFNVRAVPVRYSLFGSEHVSPTKFPKYQLLIYNY